tara:strand:+ start:3144 stop:3863 length:720 start_codon:yes stop_codon:yes gene_type:complete
VAASWLAVALVRLRWGKNMATSGTRDFNLDVGEIIEEAYERCGLEVRTGYDAKSARRSLNLMFADWANRGLNLWTVSSAVITLTKGKKQEPLSADVIDILDVVYTRDGTDYEVQRISRGDYVTLPNKDTEGRTSQYYLDRQISPLLNLWAVPDNSVDTLTYYYVRRIEDAGTLVNTADLPFRFFPCMVAGLAYYLSMKRAPDRLQILKSVYEEEFQRAADEDEGRTALKLQPSMRYLRV